MEKLFFGEWLQQRLEEAGISQADLARRTGLTRGTISLLARGQTQPKAETCLAIARALALPPETVFKAADLLPDVPVPDRDPTLQELMDVMGRMSEEERKEILEYALWRFRRNRG